MKWILGIGLLGLGVAQAATTGKVLIDQVAKDVGRQEAYRVELPLTKAVAYPRDWVSDETRYHVLVVPEGTDLSGLMSSPEPDDWMTEFTQRKDTRALRFMIDTDGDVVEMYAYDQRKLQVGASGTMGKVFGPRIEGGRLKGHYLNLGDLFGSTLVIDLQFDAELWQPPKADVLPAGGGDPGKAYLKMIAAVQKGDRKAIQALQPSSRPEIDEAEFKEMLPMMQAMMPKKPTVKGGKQFGDTALLSIADAGSDRPASAEMKREDGKWVLVSSSSGSDAAADIRMPPPFEGADADLCPQLIGDGVVCGDTAFKEHAFAIRDAIGVQSGDSRHLVLLAGDKLDAKHANALWTDDLPLEPLFGKGPVRGLLLVFDGTQGTLSADEGFLIDPEVGFAKEFMLRGEAVRIGDRIYGQYANSVYDETAGENVTKSILRFSLPVVDGR